MFLARVRNYLHVVDFCSPSLQVSSKIRGKWTRSYLLCQMKQLLNALMYRQRRGSSQVGLVESPAVLQGQPQGTCAGPCQPPSCAALLWARTGQRGAPGAIFLR